MKIKQWLYPLILITTSLPVYADNLFGHPVSNYIDQLPNCLYNTKTCASTTRYHTGIDYWNSGSFSPYAKSNDVIVAAGDGVVEQVNSLGGSNDHGFGNNVIVKHKLSNGQTIYSLYGHLYSIDSSIKVGALISKGKQIGIMGASGNGSLTKWSDAIGRNNVHLHFEMKSVATTSDSSYSYWGYVPGSPDNYGYYNPNSYIGKIKFVPNPMTYFDGAGSLISPTQAKTGGNNDVAMMQAHASIGLPSTVVFQFKKDAACDHIDISSSPKIDAVIQSKYWSDHLISNTFAGALPMSVSNKGGFTVVAVTSAKPLTYSVSVSAQCKPASSPSVNTAITPISNEVTQLVTLSNDYYWTGSGSIISGLGSGTGKTSDFVPTFDTKKSFTTFQWQTTSSCSKLKLSSTSNINVAFNSITDNEVGLKEWNALNWEKQACIGLPCNISAPSIGKYYIVKVKTDAGAMTGTSGSSNNSGYLNAQCVQ